MPTMITCPSCTTQFEPTGAIAQSIERELRGKMETEWKRRMETLNAEKQQLEQQTKKLQQLQEQQEQELKKRVDDACREREVVMEKELRTRLQDNFQNQLQLLQEQQREKEAQLKASRQTELELNRKLMEMEDLKARMELDKQKELMQARQHMEEELRRQEDERFKLREQEHQLKLRELEKQLADQKKLAEEALRKAEQGSMQLQGEIQELALEDLLRQSFPFDKVNEVGKGVRGADCILTVRNSVAQEVGCIIFESKRTKEFSADWIDKLKADMINRSADLAVIVTQAMPKDIDRFGEQRGVYICGFAEVKSLVTVLRQALLKIYEAKKSQENKGDKMVMLYDYLTGSEFMSQWNTMRESFQNFRKALQKERDDFEKNWKKKEKLLELIINNSLQISGSIEGISGMESLNWSHAGSLPEESRYVIE